MSVIPETLINHILSFRPTHPTARIIRLQKEEELLWAVYNNWKIYDSVNNSMKLQYNSLVVRYYSSGNEDNELLNDLRNQLNNVNQAGLELKKEKKEIQKLLDILNKCRASFGAEPLTMFSFDIFELLEEEENN
jgi:hypothetical protein